LGLTILSEIQDTVQEIFEAILEIPVLIYRCSYGYLPGYRRDHEYREVIFEQDDFELDEII
jgi:hypothetical protein